MPKVSDMNILHHDAKRHWNIFSQMKFLPNTHWRQNTTEGFPVHKAIIKAQDILAMSDLREKKTIFFPMFFGTFTFYKSSPGFLS